MTETSQPPRGKGRPTPKRSEAVAKRRKPVVTPRGKGAAKVTKEERREQRRKVREAMLSGDERYLPPLAAGPERALVRDVVDARRSFGWLAIPAWFVGIALSMIPTAPTQIVGTLTFPLLIGLLILDSVAAAKAVGRALDAKWPDGTDQPRKKLVWYGVARNTQFRRQRRPRPRVERGAELPR